MGIPKGLKRRRDPRAAFAPMIIRGAIKATVPAPTLFDTKPASELLFDGYISPLFTTLRKMQPDQPIPEKFGLFSDVSIFTLFDHIFNFRVEK